MTDRAEQTERPVLFLDVDGTLLPLGGTRSPAAPVQDTPNPLLARLDPAHGPRLLALPCELMWATTWMADANEVISPLLGLPRLPVVELPETPQGEAVALHHKTRPLVDTAAGRSFIWVDDEITDVDRAWVAAHHPGRALLHRVDAAVGLTEGDFAVLEAWLWKGPR
ncbi:HAD domain-containing protein [Streptomyces sp. NPDC018693]|uniref:HAD domain-containing protein n=1 Tax=unclassified Streptomyces TaxID=2593676 RepID=UPI0037B456FE